ncbi:hypothetical protein B4N89_20655 [Embleya scabrispora]|uniref:Uncharacterized protein n=1 Tax=Embleya scabrispora TaxID=159449 RepID=A0A1T3P1P1_9ACTN|nr:hypothetical protein [Embleya scabrispora]OPC83026.1 hypothetical protein B4N89_20655 [Embleya scabrispora]
MARSIVEAIGDQDVTDDIAFNELCERIRKIGREGATHISYLADEIRGLLSELPEHPDADHSSKKRASLIAGHIQSAADAFNTAAVCAARAKSSFSKHMAPELDDAYGTTRPKAAKKPDFKIGGKK